MTRAERIELAALNAYWPKANREMSYEQYRRWTDLQVKAKRAEKSA